MHIFPYSRRPGTPADKMPGQIVNAVKNRRAREAQRIAAEMHAEFLRRSVGGTLPVLFETEADGRCTGHSDTYILVSAEGSGLRGTVRDVRITGTDGETLTGTLI